ADVTAAALFDSVGSMKERRQRAIALAALAATITTLVSSLALAEGRLGASEKDVLRAGVAACLKGPDSGLRPCLQRLPQIGNEQQPTLPGPDSKWQFGTKTDKVDGSKTTGIALDSSDGLSGILGIKNKATLFARCRNNKTDVYVSWPEFIGIGDSKEVKWRVDGQPVAVEWWMPSADGQAVFAPAAVAFLKKLVGGQELVLSVGSFNKLPQALSFPISGADNAIKPVRDACKW